MKIRAYTLQNIKNMKVQPLLHEWRVKIWSLFLMNFIFIVDFKILSPKTKVFFCAGVFRGYKNINTDKIYDCFNRLIEKLRCISLEWVPLRVTIRKDRCRIPPSCASTHSKVICRKGITWISPSSLSLTSTATAFIAILTAPRTAPASSLSMASGSCVRCTLHSSTKWSRNTEFFHLIYRDMVLPSASLITSSPPSSTALLALLSRRDLMTLALLVTQWVGC